MFKKTADLEEFGSPYYIILSDTDPSKPGVSDKSGMGIFRHTNEQIEMLLEYEIDLNEYIQTADKVAQKLLINETIRRARGIYEYRVQKLRYREARKAKRMAQRSKEKK